MSIPYIETPTIEELISSQQEDPVSADQSSIVTITNFGPGVVDTDGIGYIIESGLAAQENNSGIIVTIDAMWDNEQVEGYLFEQRPKDGTWETIAQQPKLVTIPNPGWYMDSSLATSTMISIYQVIQIGKSVVPFKV